LFVSSVSTSMMSPDAMRSAGFASTSSSRLGDGVRRRFETVRLGD
jgi:hypothetical protein